MSKKVVALVALLAALAGGLTVMAALSHKVGELEARQLIAAQQPEPAPLPPAPVLHVEQPTQGVPLSAAIPPVARMTHDDAKSALTTLESWPDSRRYWLYLYDLATSDILDSTSFNHRIDEIAKGGLMHDPLGVGEGIKMIAPKEFDVIPGDPAQRVATVPHGFGQPLPVRAAAVMTSHWRQGFTTRLLLGRFLATLPAAQESFDATRAQAWDLRLPEAYIDPQSYVTTSRWTGKVTMKDELPFDQLLDDLMDRESLAPVGIAYGWRAADELERWAMSDPAGRPAYDAAWQLIRARHDAKDLGRVSAYTLQYLAGFTQVAAVREAAHRHNVPLQSEDALARLLADLNLTADRPEGRSLVARFHAWWVEALYQAAVSPRENTDESRRELAELAAFLQGWQEGGTLATDRVLRDFYRQGYRDGLRDGYARGYRDGLSDSVRLAGGVVWGQLGQWMESASTVLESTPAEALQPMTQFFLNQALNSVTAAPEEG